MKIAVNTRFLLANRLEGIGRVTHELLRRMVARHPEDTFYFFFDRAFDEQFVFGDNVHPIVLLPPARHPLLWYIWFEWSVANKLALIEPDVFFSPDGYLSLRASTPTLMAVHDIAHFHYPQQIPLLARMYYQYFIPRYLKRANQIACVSEFVRQDVLKHYPVEEEKMHTIYNSSSDDFRPIPEKERAHFQRKYAGGNPYFLYVGAIHPRKNTDRLINAFDQFKKDTGSSFQLIIAGRMAWQTGAVKKAFQAATHQNAIHFPGFIPPHELLQLMAAAFAFVYVSEFEGFGLPILEAMRCDVPVITSNVSSLPEVAGDAAILVAPDAESELVNAMKALAGDEQLRENLIQKGRLRWRHFDWDRSAEQMYALLKQTASGSR